MRRSLLPVLPILCLTALLSACGDRKEIVVPTVRLEKVEIDPALLQPPWRPAPVSHPDQRRRAALTIELLDAALNACAMQIDQIRQQHDRALAPAR